jgi:hypothetical protein
MEPISFSSMMDTFALKKFLSHTSLIVQLFMLY